MYRVHVRSFERSVGCVFGLYIYVYMNSVYSGLEGKALFPKLGLIQGHFRILYNGTILGKVTRVELLAFSAGLYLDLLNTRTNSILNLNP